MENQQSQQINPQQPVKAINTEKLIKRIRNTGIFSMIFGIILVLLYFIFILIYRKLDTTTMILIMKIILSIPFIIFGSKIKKELNNSDPKSFTMLIGLMIIVGLFSFLTSGGVGVLYFIALVVFINGYSAFKKIKSTRV